MNSAEMKIDLFRRIDNLSEKELQTVYENFIAFLDTTTTYNLSDKEIEVVEEALKAGKKDKSYSHKEIISEAKRRYPNLKF